MALDCTLSGDEAAFSSCRRFRYRLLRRLGVQSNDTPPKIIAFCMLNPSTADAFTDDRTVARCMKFAARWGGTVLEVVNLFALRTPYPSDLKAADERGADTINDWMIEEVARRASQFLVAWGNDGALDGRDQHVVQLLRRAGCTMWHLGLTDGGFPKHPLARGKHYIPDTQTPVEWTA